MSPADDRAAAAAHAVSRPPRARIDLGALVANCGLARRLAGGARILAVVKADAYGHGAVEVARALDGVADALAVARVSEGLELRRAGIGAPVVVLQGSLAAGELDEALRHGLEMVVHRDDQLEEVVKAERPVGRVWLKVDTGMHRVGFDAAALGGARHALAAAPGVSEIVLMSHLARADEVDSGFTRRQLERFRTATEGFEEARSLANSAAVLAWPETHLDWVRPGIMLYGVSPFDPPHSSDVELSPVMRLESEVIAVRRVEPGEGVGYGRRWVASRAARVGTVAIGYGDGYPRSAPDGTPVAVAGRRAGLVGRVSMDSLTVDLTEHPDADVGAPVELWGPTVPVEEVARFCGTIGYELLSRVKARVPRLYTGAGSDEP